MRFLSVLRMGSFAAILAATVLAGPAVSADGACSQYGHCEYCDSGSRCYVPGGDPDACDAWDNTSASCDFAGTFCTSSGTGVGVVCECLPCNN